MNRRFIGVALFAVLVASGCTPNADKDPLKRVRKQPPKSERIHKPVAVTPERGSSKPWRPRPVAQIVKEGNFLKGSGSLYLRQHQNNPLEWYPWGPQALQRAKEEDKPIFLSIGYASCHWCHVMEHEVFEKAAVAEFMNANFVNIKVDREERPDLDKVYMEAVVSMVGRGGWPMTVFLTPDLKPFKGGTYFPEDRFMRLAQNVLHRFKTDRAAITQEGENYARHIASGPQLFAAGALTEDFLRGATQRLEARFDTEWGGFRQRTKFPTPARWSFMLNHFRKWGTPSLGKQVDVTLEKMATGGIYDHVGGGFHRYSVERKWMIPHFEKMLYDNGQLIELYVNGYATFGRPLYRDVAVDIMDFLMREMQDPQGGFYASFDADSGGEEGTYYVWTREQLVKAAGATDGAALAAILDVTERGNFEHHTTVLSRGRRSLAWISERLNRPVSELQRLWPRYREKLRQIRSKRVAPGLDKKIVTAWNGLAIAGFARGYQMTGHERYLKAAERAAEYLWRVHRGPDGGVYRASNGGRVGSSGILDDYAFWADGLVTLFQVSGRKVHIDRALKLLEHMEARFKEPNGAWYLTEASASAPLGRQIDTDDAVRPSGIARALRASLQVAALRGEPKRFERVRKALTNYMSVLRRSHLSTAAWLDVGLLALGPYYEVVVAGDKGSGAEALMAALQKKQPPWVVGFRVPSEGASPAFIKELPPAFGKTAREGIAFAYVCIQGSCNKPTSDVNEFRKQFMEGWTR